MNPTLFGLFLNGADFRQLFTYLDGKPVNARIVIDLEIESKNSRQLDSQSEQDQHGTNAVADKLSEEMAKLSFDGDGNVAFRLGITRASRRKALLRPLSIEKNPMEVPTNRCSS